MTNPHLVLGKDYVKPKSTAVIPLADQTLAGVSPGRKPCILKKQDGNEDALAHVVLPGGARFLLIADGHFGSLSSEMAVTRFGQVLGDEGLPMAERMLIAHYALDQIIREAATGTGPASATTFISVYLDERELVWCSTGDSYLWLMDRGNHRQANTTQDLFLGDGSMQVFFRMLQKWGLTDVLTEPDDLIRIICLLVRINCEVAGGTPSRETISELLAKVTSISGNSPDFGVDDIIEPWHPLHLNMARLTPHVGRANRRSGERLMLVTDGIDEATSGLSREQVIALACEDKPLEKVAKTLLDKTLGRAGGGDNLTFLLARL